MSYDYSENILVQESAGHLLEDELGWRVELAYNTEVLGETGTFGRKSYKEILLVKYLKEALLKLNPWLTPALLEDAIKTFESHMSSASLMQINEENYRHIRDGIPVKVKKQNGQIEEKKAIVIDFTNPENNDFLAIREMKIHGDLYRRRTDIVGFVNGIPLLFIELKKNSVDVQNAYTDNYTDYLDTIPHMVNLLPTAARIGFTGTPLLLNDNITERTFGGYISIYDFKRAVEDKATVPLYYENRGEKILDLDNPDITDKILDAIEATDLDPNQTKKLEREFKKEIHIMTAPQRLKSVAKDFVSHYSDLWTSGKAMFVCLNKVTCVRMYNLVQNYWEEEIKRLEGIKSKVSQQEVQELERKIKWMKETEMAVVISQEQNEIQTFKKWDLDIKPHREKMEKRELDKEFKDKDNPLRVVFVCAMWLTGFDVKCLSCLYLDKPLKAHTLMQTIARANRVAEGKSNGLIIDYIGIVKALRKALADYTANVGGRETDPTIDKEELIEHVLETISAAIEFLCSRNFELEDLIKAKDFSKLALLQTAANAVSDSRESRKEF